MITRKVHVFGIWSALAGGVDDKGVRPGVA